MTNAAYAAILFSVVANRQLFLRQMNYQLPGR
jgi:hypothetical protein